MLGYELLLGENPLLRFSQLLGELGSAMVDGGDEAVGRGTDGCAEIIIFKKQVLSLLGG